nr:hypothetical protein [uncultured Flavobacterium sp.]
MKGHNFEITPQKLNELLGLFPNLGKNSDIGKFAVEVAKLFILSLNPNSTFNTKRGVDLSVTLNGIEEDFEIKGSAANDIGWNKLKVSSQFCHDNLINGMNIIRVTNIGQINMTIYYLNHDEDFELVPEVRWTIKKRQN